MHLIAAVRDGGAAAKEAALPINTYLLSAVIYGLTLAGGGSVLTYLLNLQSTAVQCWRSNKKTRRLEN